MRELTEAEVAWLAGIYEGEGSCSITTGRAIRIEIVMTDKDIIERLQTITGVGTIQTLPPRKTNHKEAYRWGIGGINAVVFFESVMPWLGQRRKQRAQDAISNWKTNKKQSSRGDAYCVNNHEFNAPGNKRTKWGSCHLCNLDASKKYREKRRSQRPPETTV